MRKIIYILFGTILLLLTGCQQEEEKTTIIVLAAASLKEPLEEMKELYEQDHPVDIQLQFGSSGKLAKQIVQGAKADLFISADTKWMTYLLDENFIHEKNVHTFLYNSLVFIKQKDATLQMNGLKEVDQIAIGHPETVPAGRYAKQVLENEGLWEVLESKLVYTNDVRQALTYVETGNADVGIVYKTDALLSKNVEIMEEIDPSLHDEIEYPVGMMKDREEEEVVGTFLQWLLSEEANDIKAAYEFEGM